MEERWKLSKKESICSTSSSSDLYTGSSSTKSSSLLRSVSTRSSAEYSSCTPLPRSFSQKCSRTSNTTSSSSSSTSHHPKSLPKSASIGRKCSSLAKEQKARFYIIRRCVAMLVCWHKHGDKST